MTEPLTDRRQSIVQPPNNLPYVVAVVVMILFAVCAIAAIVILREKDNTAVIATIVGFVAPTTLSLLAFMKAQETHLSVNSRLDAFMANAKMAAHAQGMAEGRTQGQHEADVRTDTLATLRNGGLPSSGAIPTVEAPVIVVTSTKPPPPREES